MFRVRLPSLVPREATTKRQASDEFASSAEAGKRARLETPVDSDASQLPSGQAAVSAGRKKHVYTRPPSDKYLLYFTVGEEGS